jgi:adenosylcobyric acid synthase
MARTVLVAGTASHVGKSTVAAGLCRLLADRGVDVAPFKGQNMSNNARAVPRPGPESGGTWGEIGVSQYVQARAARSPARADINPVLLKPTGDGTSQVVIHGEAVEHVPVDEFYGGYWDRAREAVRRSHERLAAEHDVLIAEGAGALAEPNLLDRDLANRETAAIADADVVLVADIERGGAFASVVGTLELAPADLRERIIGVLITKFRGERSVLEPALKDLESRTGVPVLGVLPHDDPGLPAEDSVDLPAADEIAVRGTDDGVPDADSVTVAVPRLPHIANFTDLEPLAREPGVRVAYVPLSADLSAAAVDGGPPDGVVIPGTKNTVDDLLAMRSAGLADEVAAFDGPVVGLCGGYQLLGERIVDPDVESTAAADAVDGLGLLPVETRFSSAKTVRRVERDLRGVGPLAGARGPVTGYEIHLGETTCRGGVERPFDGRRSASDRVLGTYLHGLFGNAVARSAFRETLFAGTDASPPASPRDPEPAEAAAALLEENADLGRLSLP